jgi:DNA-binding CsgD family transcriptional regulator
MLKVTDKYHKNLLSFNTRKQKHIQQLCEPLFNHFPINHFFYSRFFNDGRYFMIGSHKQAVELYLNHTHTQPDKVFLEEFVQIPDSSKYKHLWPSTTSNPAPQIAHLNDMDICHGLNVTVNKGDFLETFSFAAKREDHQIVDLYLNSFHILERFMVYFQEKGKPLFERYSTEKMPHSALYEREMNKVESEDDREMLQFFKETRIHKHRLRINGVDAKLSPREFECLMYFSQGKSVKETAGALNLSPYTIETYLANLKSKLGVANKSKLVSCFLQSA